MQLLCTLRNHCRQWPRNTRYQADATPYLGRTFTGWIAPACGWRTSFDHLVGDGEHAWAHFDAERLRRLKIDDELEPRRLQHWEIGRFRAFKDAAGVHADLTTHLELVGSVAHQPAGGDISPLRITRWYPLAGGQDRKLHTAAAEESVGPDKESIGTLVRKRGKGSIDLANCGGLEYPKLKPDDRGGLLQVPQCVLGGRRIGRIDKHGNTSSRGDQLMQQPQPLGCHLFGEKINSRRIAPRTGKAGHKTKLDRIPRYTEYDWDRCSYRFGRARRRPAARDSDHRHWAANQIGHQCRQPIVLALQPVVLDSDVLPFDVTGFLETFTERGHITRSDFRSPRVQKLDHRHRRLLRARRERPRGRRAANQGDELAPFHSITSSASASSLSGIWRPSAFAVLRLITSSYLVGSTTGRSADFSPLRMRPA